MSPAPSPRGVILTLGRVSIMKNALRSAKRTTIRRKPLSMGLGGMFLICLFTVGSAQTTQDFDGPGTEFAGLSLPLGNVPPAVIDADGFSEGQFLRLKSFGINNCTTVSFDRTDTGPHARIIAEFDFRITCSGDRWAFGRGGCADGFSFVLLDTAVFDVGGANALVDENGAIREATPPFSLVPSNSFAVGFNIFQRNDIVLTFNNASIGIFPIDANVLDLATGVDGNPGVFHHAEINLILDGLNPNVTVTITDGADPNNSVTPLLNFDLSSVVQEDVSLVPYEGRVAFGARSGGLAIAADLDNIDVQFFPTEAPPPEELPLDHFLSYEIKRSKGEPRFERREVFLTSQSTEGFFNVEKPVALLNPAEKDGEGINDPDTHLLGDLPPGTSPPSKLDLGPFEVHSMG